MVVTLGISRQRFGTTNTLQQRFAGIDIAPQLLAECAGIPQLEDGPRIGLGTTKRIEIGNHDL